VCAIVTNHVTNFISRTLLVLTIGFLWLGGTREANAQSNSASGLLYRAVVIGDDAVVRSGPGKTHYGTDRLRPGSVVKVFREDPGGWMAIRPPARSFSLVQRDEIEIYQNGLAKVTADETVAWVGTRLNPVKKPMWQVKLRKGEMLEVLGVVDRNQYELEDSEPDWVQVQPPAGEFRWIQGTDIRAEATNIASDSPQIPGELSESELPEFQVDSEADFQNTTNRESSVNGPAPFDSWEPSPQSSQWDLQVEPDTDSFPTTDLNSTTSIQSSGSMGSVGPADNGWRPARQTIANFTNQRSDFTEEDRNNESLAGTWQNDAAAGSSLSGTMGQPTVGNASVRSNIFDPVNSTGGGAINMSGTPTTAAPLAGLGMPDLANGRSPGAVTGNASLSALEMRLTQELIKPPGQWQLEGLAAEVQRARNAGLPQQDNSFLDRLMEKIRKCREVKAGYRATDGQPNDSPVDLQTRSNLPGGYGNNPGVRQASLDQMDAANGANLLNNYDAYGILNELVRDGGLGQSTYVLQDANGRVTHHISAPPGVNLRRYLHQRVGIIGNRGFHQQLKLDHVTAERVIPMNSVRR